MVPENTPYQLPLVATVGERQGKLALRGVLEQLDSRGLHEIDAVALVDLPRHGGRVGRPIPYLCDNNDVYWTKTRAQTGLASELIVNRLAWKLDVGPPTAIVRIDPFLATVGSSTRAVGTINLTNVVASKELKSASTTRAPSAVDLDSRARTAVFQSWIDVVDEQVLVRTTDGRVFSYDHGDSFRTLLPGPPLSARIG